MGEQLVTVVASPPFDHLPEHRDQFRFALQAQEVIPQVIAEWPRVLGGVREQVVDARRRRIAREHVERFARQVRMPADERIQPLHVRIAKRLGVERIQPSDLLGHEILEREERCRR